MDMGCHSCPRGSPAVPTCPIRRWNTRPRAFRAQSFDRGLRALKNPTLFNQVFIEHGAVTWPGDLDLAPDAMYAAIKADGEWVLR